VLWPSATIYCHVLFLFCGGLIDIPFCVLEGTRLLGGGREAALPLLVEVVLALVGGGPGGGGGAKLCRAGERGGATLCLAGKCLGGGDGAEYGSARLHKAPVLLRGVQA
jgi:hypothetical protein